MGVAISCICGLAIPVLAALSTPISQLGRALFQALFGDSTAAKRILRRVKKSLTRDSLQELEASIDRIPFLGFVKAFIQLYLGEDEFHKSFWTSTIVTVVFAAGLLFMMGSGNFIAARCVTTGLQIVGDVILTGILSYEKGEYDPQSIVVAVDRVIDTVKKKRGCAKAVINLLAEVVGIPLHTKYEGGQKRC